jgi:hypothetical protein
MHAAQALSCCSATSACLYRLGTEQANTKTKPVLSPCRYSAKLVLRGPRYDYCVVTGNPPDSFQSILTFSTWCTQCRKTFHAGRARTALHMDAIQNLMPCHRRLQLAIEEPLPPPQGQSGIQNLAIPYHNALWCEKVRQTPQQRAIQKHAQTLR